MDNMVKVSDLLDVFLDDDAALSAQREPNTSYGLDLTGSQRFWVEDESWLCSYEVNGAGAKYHLVNERWSLIKFKQVSPTNCPGNNSSTYGNIGTSTCLFEP